MFLTEMYNSLEVNLRKGYRDLFIWFFTLMPFLKYYFDAHSKCPNCNQVFLKNMLVLFILYSFIMIVFILGHALVFMMNYKKIEPKIDPGSEPYNVYSKQKLYK